jgi:hypothetical protein
MISTTHEKPPLNKSTIQIQTVARGNAWDCLLDHLAECCGMRLQAQTAAGQYVAVLRWTATERGKYVFERAASTLTNPAGITTQPRISDIVTVISQNPALPPFAAAGPAT